ncbi:MAG: TIM44-like domain-containing protein [bacterium]
MSAHEAFARGGGGGSGGGGGGGGSGGGSCYGWVSCSISIGLRILIPLCIIVYGWYQRKKKIERAKKIIDKADDADPAWSESKLVPRVREVFEVFESDWSNNNAEAMKAYCMPKFQDKMALDLAVLALQKRKNVMTNINLMSVAILDADDESDNAYDNFTAEVYARANDQLIDTTTGKVLMNENQPFTESWNFVRDGDAWKLNSIRQATEKQSSLEVPISKFAERNGFHYDPDFGWLMMPNKGVIFNYSNFKTSDINNHVIGKFKDKIVEFYTFIPNAKKGNYPNFLVAQTTLSVSYNDILVRRKHMFWNFAPSGMRKIETESNDFNRKFCLYAHPNDQINSFVLLAPDYMEEIYNLPFELNIEIVGSFLYFYVKGRKNVDEDEMMRLLSKAFDSMRFGN